MDELRQVDYTYVIGAIIVAATMTFLGFVVGFNADYDLSEAVVNTASSLATSWAGPVLICASVLAVRTSAEGSEIRSILNSVAGFLLLVAVAGMVVVFGIFEEFPAQTEALIAAWASHLRLAVLALAATYILRNDDRSGISAIWGLVAAGVLTVIATPFHLASVSFQFVNSDVLSSIAVLSGFSDLSNELIALAFLAAVVRSPAVIKFTLTAALVIGVVNIGQFVVAVGQALANGEEVGPSYYFAPISANALIVCGVVAAIAIWLRDTAQVPVSVATATV